MKKVKRKFCFERYRKPHRIAHGKNQSDEFKSVSIVMIYRSELDYISRCILDSKTIETGGQLFGFWTSTGIPVVLYALGPGPHANHQVTFFNQDLDYLVNVGTSLLQRYGLQHIGEWHSHHQLGLAHPSGHDASNMQMVINEKHLGKFLLCIGNCDERTSTLNAFYFTEGSRCYQPALWQVKEMKSPFRSLIDNELRDILVHPCCSMPNMKELKVLEENKPLFKQGYWLSEKQNNFVLKKIVDFLSQYPDNKSCDVKLDANGHVHIFINKLKGKNEEIYFPVEFPKAAPIISVPDKIVQANWSFNGDIFKAFIHYYYGISL